MASTDRMQWALAALVTATLAVPPSGAYATGSAAPAATDRLGQRSVSTAPDRVSLGGVPVRPRSGTPQVITVDRTTGWHARVSLWHLADGTWERGRSTTNGRIGYGGLVKPRQRKQGTGTTPRGTFTLTEAFGNDSAPRGTRLRFHQVRAGDFWVQDNASRHYNTLRNKQQGGFRWRLPSRAENSSERLRDYPRQYAWSVVVDFNRPPKAVRYRGSGIFLHVNGTGATAGCVSVPRPLQRRVLSWLRPRAVPVIAIGD